MSVATDLPFPAQCPSCGHPTIIKLPHLICPSPTCDEKLIGLLEHAGKRSQLDIDQLGPEVAEGLVRSGMVANLADLFKLSAEALAHMPYGKNVYGVARATKLHKGISNAKNRPWATVLHSLGCPGLGEPQATEIASRYSLYDLIAVMNPVEVKMGLLSIPGIGERTALDFVTWMQANADWLFEITQHLQTVPAAPDNSPKPLKGYTLVCTGSFSTKSARSAYEKRLKELGAVIGGSVSSKTTILFTGSGVEGNEKYLKAKELGIPIQTEEELKQLLKEHES